MTNTRFFFYGTLMSSAGRSGALEGLAHPVANGLMRGDMYSVGEMFPAVVDGNGVVLGEVWEANDEGLVPLILERLDRIEGYEEGRPFNHYLRERRTLLAPQEEVWTYIYNHPTVGLERIASGDWRHFDWQRQWDREAERIREAS